MTIKKLHNRHTFKTNKVLFPVTVKRIAHVEFPVATCIVEAPPPTSAVAVVVVEHLATNGN